MLIFVNILVIFGYLYIYLVCQISYKQKINDMEQLRKIQKRLNLLEEKIALEKFKMEIYEIERNERFLEWKINNH